MKVGHITVLAAVLFSGAQAWANNGSTSEPAADTPPAAADDDENGNIFTMFWDNGFQGKTKDGNVSIKIGGRIQQDTSFDHAGSQLGNAFTFEDGSEFRRARIFIQGEHKKEGIEWKTQYDFAGGTAEFKDVYMGFKNTPVNIRIGQMKEPFSLEELTSSNNISFMERATPNALAPGRNTGIMFHDSAAEGNLFWAAGIFRSSTDDQGGDQGGGEYAITARVAGTPYKENGNLVHVGGAVTVRSPDDDEVDITQRPEWHLAPKILDSGTISNVDSIVGYGLEAAGVWGPFSLQSEYIMWNLDVDGMSDSSLHGHYVYGSWFVTEGDQRKYKKGAFGGVKPKRPMGDGGIGAVEVLARYSMLEFEDVVLPDDDLTGLIAGVNWYLNGHMRFMLNGGWSELDSLDGSADFLGVRFQVTF